MGEAVCATRAEREPDLPAGNGACEPSQRGGGRGAADDIAGAATASRFDHPLASTAPLEPPVGEPLGLARDENEGVGRADRPERALEAGAVVWLEDVHLACGKLAADAARELADPGSCGRRRVLASEDGATGRAWAWLTEQAGVPKPVAGAQASRALGNAPGIDLSPVALRQILKPGEREDLSTEAHPAPVIIGPTIAAWARTEPEPSTSCRMV